MSAEPKIKCRYCSQPLEEKEMVCSFCGLNQQTGVITKPACEVPHATFEETKKARTEKRQSNAGFLIWVLIVFGGFYLFSQKGWAGLQVARTRAFIARLTSGKVQLGKDDKKKKQSFKMGDIMRGHFERKPEPPKKYESLKIEGIFFDPHSKTSVIINGKLLFTKDTIEDFVVEKINPDSVELSKGAERFTLKPGEAIPLPSAEQ